MNFIAEHYQFIAVLCFIFGPLLFIAVLSLCKTASMAEDAARFQIHEVNTTVTGHERPEITASTSADSPTLVGLQTRAGATILAGSVGTIARPRTWSVRLGVVRKFSPFNRTALGWEWLTRLDKPGGRSSHPSILAGGSSKNPHLCNATIDGSSVPAVVSTTVIPVGRLSRQHSSGMPSSHPFPPHPSLRPAMGLLMQSKQIRKY